MAANGQVFQDAQSQQETQVYDSDPMDVEKVNEEEVPLTQADGANDEPEEETQNHDSVVQVPASEAEEVCASPAKENEPEASKQLVQPDPSRGFRPLPGAASVEGIGWKDLREMGQGADQYCSTCRAHVDPAPEKRGFQEGPPPVAMQDVPQRDHFAVQEDGYEKSPRMEGPQRSSGAALLPGSWEMSCLGAAVMLW